MFSIRHYVILAVLIFIGKAALASVLIEPYVGYSLGGKIDLKETSQKYDYSGMNYGGRLGVDYLGLMGGFAYDHGSYTATYKEPSSSIDLLKSLNESLDSEWSVNSYGVFVGYNFPILFRVWGTYFLSADWKATKDGGGEFKDNKMKSTAYELGFGYKILPILSLNLQYRVADISKKEYSDGSTEPDNYKKASTKSGIVSISVPISF